MRCSRGSAQYRYWLVSYYCCFSFSQCWLRVVGAVKTFVVAVAPPPPLLRAMAERKSTDTKYTDRENQVENAFLSSLEREGRDESESQCTDRSRIDSLIEVRKSQKILRRERERERERER